MASPGRGVVVGWQVYANTHEPLSLGLIGLGEALPFISFALPAGYVADRWNRRSVAVASLCVLGLCSAALLWLSASPALSARLGVAPVYAVIFGVGIARSVYQPARQALGAELVPRNQLENAIAWRSGTWQIAAVVGPTAGGLLYGLASPGSAYALDGALMGFALARALSILYTPAALRIEGHPLVTGLLF